MKTIHIIPLVMLLSQAMAQPSTFLPATQGQVAVRPTASLVAARADAHYTPAGNQQPGWYISTNPATLQTSIVFLDSSRRVIYEEKLPNQYVELNSFNRKVLDQMLTQLTSRQLMVSRLRTRPIPPEKPQIAPLALDSFIPNLPAETPTASPTGIQSRVTLLNQNLVRIWWKGPAPEKITLWVRKHMGETLRLNTSKTSQFTDVLPVTNLAEGIYDIRLSGKTWHMDYELTINRDSKQTRIQLSAPK